MYIHPAIYDLDELFLENMHTHARPFSRCAKPESTFFTMIKAAEEAGLSRFALTDHTEPDDGAAAEVIFNTHKAELAQIETSMQVLIGAELSAYGIDRYTMENSGFEPEYRLYACNHYHLDKWEQPEDTSPDGYKKHAVAVMRSIIKTGRCDCIAHPYSDRHLPAAKNWQENAYFFAWTDNDLGDLFTLALQYETAWELHPDTILHCRSFARRFFGLGKEVGAVFNMGTDAHIPANVPTKRLLSQYKEILL